MKKKKPFKFNESNFDHSGKAKSRKEMANELNMSLSAFMSRLREIKFDNGGRMIMPRDQIEILNKLRCL